MITGSLALLATGPASAADVGLGSAGSTVAYSDGTYIYTVHVNTDGSHGTPVQLKDNTGSPYQGIDPSISPAGDLLAFRTGVSGGTAGVAASAGSAGTLVLVPIAGGVGPIGLVNQYSVSGAGWNPAMTNPANEQLAYIVATGGNGAYLAKATVHHNGSTIAVDGITALTNTNTNNGFGVAENAINPSEPAASPTATPGFPASSTYHPHNSQVTWSPDGTKLAYTSYVNMHSVQCSDEEEYGGIPANNDNNPYSLAGANDCQYDTNLNTINSDGSSAVAIQHGIGESNPSWNNQAYIAFSSYGRENTQVMILPGTDANTPCPVLTTGIGYGEDMSYGNGACSAGNDVATTNQDAINAHNANNPGNQLLVAQSQWGWNPQSTANVDPATSNPQLMQPVLGEVNGAPGPGGAAHLWAVTPAGAGLFGNASPSPIPGQGQGGNVGDPVNGTHDQGFQMVSFTTTWLHNYENASLSADSGTVAFALNGTLNLATLNTNSNGGLGTPVSTGLNAQGGLSLWTPPPLDSVTRNADGSWQYWGQLPLIGLPGGALNQVSTAHMNDGSTQYVARGSDGNYYHALQDSNGTWHGWNPLPGINGAANFGGPQISIANIGISSARSGIAAIGLDGNVWQNMRYSDGTWAGWGAYPLPNGAVATKVAQSTDSFKDPYVMALGNVTVGGVVSTHAYIWTSVTNSWQQLADLPAHAYAGDIALAGTETANSYGTQMAVIDSSGQIWHQMLTINNTNLNFSYSGWAQPAQPTGGAAHLAATGMSNGDAQFIATNNNGTLYHDIRYAAGNWSGWGAPAGLPGAGSSFTSNGALAITDQGNNNSGITAFSG